MKEQLNDYLMLLLGDARNIVFILFLIFVGYTLRNILRSHFGGTHFEPIPKATPGGIFNETTQVALVGKAKSFSFTVKSAYKSLSTLLDSHEVVYDVLVEKEGEMPILYSTAHYRTEQRKDGLHLHVFTDTDNTLIGICLTEVQLAHSRKIVEIVEPKNDNKTNEPTTIIAGRNTRHD